MDLMPILPADIIGKIMAYNKKFHPLNKEIICGFKTFILNHPEKERIFIKAIENGKYEIIKLMLVNKIVDPKADDIALQLAAKNGFREIIELLLKAGAKPNDETLKNAVSYGNTEAVILLLEAGVDPNANCGEAFENAIERGYTTIVEILLIYGGNPEGSDNEYIRNAAEDGHAEIVRALLKAGADPNVQDGTCSDALTLAMKNNHVAVVKILIQHGMGTKFQRSKYILEWAIEYGHVEIVKLLLDRP